jgi:subtilisin family serine protease
MIHFLRLATIVGMSIAMTGQVANADPIMKRKISGNAERKITNRRLLVRYKDEVSPNKINESHFSVGAYVVRNFDLPENLQLVEVAKGISVKTALDYYRNDPKVAYAEPDYEVHAFFSPPPKDPTDPNDPPSNDTLDPKFAEQWGLHNAGQTGGTADADINAPEMWARVKGDKNLVVAVIDTGVNYEHPDLKANIWTNPGEIPGNGIDDDGNGVVDDVHGFNAVANNGNPMDDHGHGSHCAGVIGAESNNVHGGRGVMQDVSIIGCKFLSASGGGTTSGAIACLDYLRNLKTRSVNPVNIIATSNSWGGGPSSEALKDAIKAHQDLGILFVAAASNDSADNDVVETYPADYPLANIISVAASNSKDEKAYFSNFGKRSVHVGAPGEDILSTVLGSEYEMMSGTSMATPFVTGLAGMIKADQPQLNYLQVKNLVMAGGVPTPALVGKTVSGRRIRAIDSNGRGSLSCQNQIVSGRLSPTQDRLLVKVGDSITLSAININCAQPNGDIVVPFSPGNGKLRLKDDGIGIDSATDDGLYTREWRADAAGRYEFIFPDNDKVRVSVYDPSAMREYEASTEALMSYRNFEGTALEAGDDWTATIDTPFPIKFGDENQSFDMLTIGSNGAMSLTNTDPVDLSNVNLPASKYTTLIAPFWDDLNPAASGDLFYTTMGVEPNREFIVEWRDVRHYSSSDGATFQVVFFENSSDILFNYLDVDFGTSSVDKGASATVGVQSSESNAALVTYNDAKLESNTAIRFHLKGRAASPANASIARLHR